MECTCCLKGPPIRPVPCWRPISPPLLFPTLGNAGFCTGNSFRKPFRINTLKPAGDFLPKVEDWAPWEVSSFFASLEEAETEISSQATEEIPAQLSENNPPQTDGILPVEKKRISSAQKPSRSGGRPAGNEPSFSDLRAKKTPDSPSSENPSAPPLPEAGSFLLASDLPEAASRSQAFFPSPMERLKARHFPENPLWNSQDLKAKPLSPVPPFMPFPLF